MSVTPSSLIPVGTTPSEVDLLWAMAYILPAEWAKEVEVTRGYSTDIGSSKNDAEHRYGFLGKPTNGISVTLRAIGNSGVRRLKMFAQRAMTSRFLFPFFTEQGIISAPASSTSLTFDTQHKRFFVGARVVVYSSALGTFSVRTVSAKTDAGLTLSQTLPTTFPAGSYVYPLMEAKLLLAAKGTLTTDNILDLKIEAVETPGPWCLDSVASAGAVPSGFESYLDIPILHIEPDWANNPDFSLRRTGAFGQSGIAQIATTYGSRGRAEGGVFWSFLDRAAFWPFLRFFDSRLGRLHPFWMPSSASDYDIVEFTVNGISVKAEGEVGDWQYHPYIAVVSVSGAVQIRSIVNITRLGLVDTLELDSVFTDPGTIKRVCIGYLCRFDSDEMTESWKTDTVCEVRLPVVELTNEVEVVVENLDDDPLRDLVGEFVPTVDGGASEVTAPMYYHPCNAITERPPGRAADLKMPEFMSVRILPEFTVDPLFTVSSGAVSPELLAALPGIYRLQYFGGISGTSTHWDHHVVCNIGGPDIYCHSPLTVVQHRWRSVKEYLNGLGTVVETITVDFVAEWNPDPDGVNGAWGTLFHIFVTSSEVNRDYVDGTPAADGYSYTLNDPAKWFDTKHCHPRMLICATLATSWMVPCGDRGLVGCEDLGTTTFRDCEVVVENPSPWVNNDPIAAQGDVAFGARIGVVNFAGMALGGGCPTSEIMEFVVIENSLGTGLTALKPERSGWNEMSGNIDVTGGSSITYDACLPSQIGSGSTIDCCESHPDFPFGGPDGGGSPDCWRAPPNAPRACDSDLLEPPPPEISRCCFPMTSVVTVTIRQKCIQTLTRYDGACNITTPCNDKTIFAEGERRYVMNVCSAAFNYKADVDDRVMEWVSYVRDEEFDFQDFSDGFNGLSLAAWNAVEGDWDFVAGIAEGQSLGAGSDSKYNLIAVMTSSVYVNFNASVNVLNDNKSGLAFRTSGVSPLVGYVAEVDPALNILTIWKTNGSLYTAIKTVPISVAFPYTIHVVAKGPAITAWVDDDVARSCDITDCDYQSGSFAMVAYGVPVTAEFDNFFVADDDPDGYIQCRAFYNSDGWNIDIPANAMPLYADMLPGGALYLAPSDCGTPPDCGCDLLTRTLSPAFIANNQSEASSNYLNGGKPYPGSGGPGCNQPLKRCPESSPAPLSVPYADWKAATLEVDLQCRKNCTAQYPIDTCRGFEWYWGAGCSASP